YYLVATDAILSGRHEKLSLEVMPADNNGVSDFPVVSAGKRAAPGGRPMMRRFPLAILTIVVVFSLGCGGVRVRRVPVNHALIDQARRPLEAIRHDDLESFVFDGGSSAELDEAVGVADDTWFDAHASPELALVLAERSYRQARAIECRSWGRAIV